MNYCTHPHLLHPPLLPTAYTIHHTSPTTESSQPSTVKRPRYEPTDVRQRAHASIPLKTVFQKNRPSRTRLVDLRGALHTEQSALGICEELTTEKVVELGPGGED